MIFKEFSKNVRKLELDEFGPTPFIAMTTWYLVSAEAFSFIFRRRESTFSETVLSMVIRLFFMAVFCVI